jgi:hypothetical protein
MKRTALLICLASILLLATVSTAFADTSGTVYGKAVLAPYAITITGGGTDPGNPFTYQGQLGQMVPEQFGQRVVVQNSGTQDGAVSVDVNELPTAGTDVWNLATNADSNEAVWILQNETRLRDCWVLPESDPHYAFSNTADPDLVAGNSDSLSSWFLFPLSSGSSEDHNMSATISIKAPQ